MNEQAEWQHASWVSLMGKWAWVLGLINSIGGILAGLGGIGAGLALNAYYAPIIVYRPIDASLHVWYIIGAIIQLFVSFAIIRPKFSNKCAERDWEALYGWYLKLGSLKLPWMFLWGIIYQIVGWGYWSGILILVPAIMLLFFGPRPYEWTE